MHSLRDVQDGENCRGTYIGPPVERRAIPRPGVEDGPEDDGHQERVRGDGGVEQAVESAQASGPGVEEDRPASAGVAGGVDAGDQVVEAQTPVGQPGEEAEALADGVAIAMGAVPAPDEEVDEEDVEGDEAAEAGEREGRQQPGGLEVVTLVERGIGAHQRVEGHFPHISGRVLIRIIITVSDGYSSVSRLLSSCLLQFRTLDLSPLFVFDPSLCALIVLPLFAPVPFPRSSITRHHEEHEQCRCSSWRVTGQGLRRKAAGRDFGG